MSDLGLDIRGLGDTTRTLQALGRAIAPTVAPSLLGALRPMEARAEAEAPVLTGELRAAIATRPGPVGFDHASAEMVVPIEHGVHRDLGTQHQRPDPFLQRAALATEAEAVEQVERAVLQVIDDLLR
jgi:hypothetical protein